MSDETSDDARMLLLLAAVDADSSEDSITNDLLARWLQWTPTEVADCLAEAKDRMLLWGVRTGGTPKPFFEDLELTVQGRRLLASGGSTGGSGPQRP